MSETYVTELSANKQIASWPDTGNVFQPLALRAMFWRPTYLEASAWLEHIPFAFWLIEAHQPRLFVELGTHQGASYFAFCQAVDRLGLDAQCFAVDTWKGDEHAGFYDEQVYEKVKAYNAAQYSGFSRLVRSTFDEAVRHFTDGSIDLLHIDGLHTLEAVRHDFDTWLPKLSKRGVVVMHDTNVRERNFGVFKLFEQVHAQYPSFEFVHGHGLGVVGVGPDQSDRLKHLFKSNENEPAKRSIHEVFSRLGLACADSLASAQQQARARKLEEEVNKQKKQLEETKQSLEKTKTDLNTRSKELADARAKIQTQIEHHAVERGQLVERATLLQEIRTELKEEVSRLQSRIDATSSELSQRIQTLIRLEEASARYEQQCHALSDDLQARDISIVDLRRENQKLQTETGALQALLRERDWDLTQVKSAQQAQGLESAQLREERARLMEQQAASQQQLQVLSAEVQTQRLSIGTLREDVQRYKTEAETSGARLVERERDLAEARRLKESQEREISELRESLASQSASAEQLSDAVTLSDQELILSRSELAQNRQEIADLKRTLEERDEALATTQNRLALAEKIHADTLDAVEKRRESHEQLQLKLKAQAADLRRITDANIVLQTDKDKLARNIEDRFKELAKLTLMLDAGEKKQTELEQCHAKAIVQLQAHVKAKETEAQRLAQEKAALQIDKDTLGRNLECLRTELEQRHSKTYEQLQLKLKVQETDLRRVTDENLALRADRDKLAGNIEDRFKELAKLTQMLDATEKKHTELEQSHAQAITRLEAELSAKEAQVQRLTHEARKSKKWYLSLMPLSWQNPALNKEGYRLKRQAKLFRDSALFDESWYLSTYSDVAQGRMDAVEHYLRFGAAEGRDPSPHFSTRFYLTTYPDVAASGINPLEHYLKYGIKEGRHAL